MESSKFRSNQAKKENGEQWIIIFLPKVKHHRVEPKMTFFLDGRHYKSASGTIDPGYNILEVGIMHDHASDNPVGFGVEVENEDGEIIQCCVILQPKDTNLFFQY